MLTNQNPRIRIINILSLLRGKNEAVSSEAKQIKSKIYNVLNIIKLDFPPLGLGTRLLEASGQCVSGTEVPLFKKLNICTETRHHMREVILLQKNVENIELIHNNSRVKRHH